MRLTTTYLIARNIRFSRRFHSKPAKKKSNNNIRGRTASSIVNHENSIRHQIPSKQTKLKTHIFQQLFLIAVYTAVFFAQHNPTAILDGTYTACSLEINVREQCINIGRS